MTDNILIADALSVIGKKLEEISDILSGSSIPRLPDEDAAPQIAPIDPTLDPAQAPVPMAAATTAEAAKPSRPGIRLDDNLELPAAAPAKPAADDVKALLVSLCKQGLTAEVKATLGNYGAASLGEVDPRYFGDLVAEAKRLAANHNDNTEVHNG